MSVGKAPRPARGPDDEPRRAARCVTDSSARSWSSAASVSRPPGRGPARFPRPIPWRSSSATTPPHVYRAVVAWYDVAPGMAVFLAGQFLTSTSRIWFARMGVRVGRRSPPSDVAAFAYGRWAGDRRRRGPSPGQSHREPGSRMADDPRAWPL